MPMFLTEHAYLGCQISIFKIIQPAFCLFVQRAVKDSRSTGKPVFILFSVKWNFLTAYICDICCGRSVKLSRNVKSFMKTFCNKFIFYSARSASNCALVSPGSMNVVHEEHFALSLRLLYLFFCNFSVI
jgi:hypothetical protein